MKLDVLQAQSDAWFAQGLRFECTQCGNCCTGEPGFIWISVEEVHRLAQHLKMDAQDVVDTYCRTIDGKLSLRERRNSHGEFDCIFLKESKVAARTSDGEPVVHTEAHLLDLPGPAAAVPDLAILAR